MTLEEAIKQKHFPNEIEKAFVNVLYTANQLYAQNRQVLKEFGVSPEQFNVLRILRGSHPKTLSALEITSRMLDKSSNATRLVDKLEHKSLASRQICPNDRRQVEVGITEKGLSLLEEIDREMKDFFQNFQHLDPESARNLNQLLDRLRG